MVNMWYRHPSHATEIKKKIYKSLWIDDSHPQIRLGGSPSPENGSPVKTLVPWAEASTFSFGTKVGQSWFFLALKSNSREV